MRLIFVILQQKSIKNFLVFEINFGILLQLQLHLVRRRETSQCLRVKTYMKHAKKEMKKK